MGPYIEGTDHGLPTAPQTEQDHIYPPRIPSPEVLVNEPEVFGDVVLDYEINTDPQAM